MQISPVKLAFFYAEHLYENLKPTVAWHKSIDITEKKQNTKK